MFSMPITIQHDVVRIQFFLRKQGQQVQSPLYIEATVKIRMGYRLIEDLSDLICALATATTVVKWVRMFFYGPSIWPGNLL